MDNNRLIYKALELQQVTCPVGGLLMDAPDHTSLEELTFMTKDTAFWREHVRHLH